VIFHLLGLLVGWWWGGWVVGGRLVQTLQMLRLAACGVAVEVIVF
jgi:hypothetical protein